MYLCTREMLFLSTVNNSLFSKKKEISKKKKNHLILSLLREYLPPLRAQRLLSKYSIVIHNAKHTLGNAKCLVPLCSKIKREREREKKRKNAIQLLDYK